VMKRNGKRRKRKKKRRKSVRDCSQTCEKQDEKDWMKKEKEEDDSTSSKIDWSRSRNRRFGRSRSRNWNRIRSIHYRNVTKPIIGSEKIPILYYGVRIDRSDCFVRIDDGVLDFVYILIELTKRELEKREMAQDEVF
jgi:hypothetical protein